MDFITLVAAKQKEKKLSDEDMAKLTGINEYTYYNLKKYRLYLSKVAYFALCGVLDIPVLKGDKVDEVVEENKQIVGYPESNLVIAAEYVNPYYLGKLETELSRLKKTVDKMHEKDDVIKKQYIEIEELRKGIEKNSKEIQEQIRQAYSDGVKEGSVKVQNMKMANNQRMMDALNEEYTKKIDNLEKSLQKLEESYYLLYKYVSFLSEVNPELGINLKDFYIPMKFQKEKLKKYNS